jgi:hypothetical protein
MFVDKEHVTIDGRKRTGDLLAKTRFRNQPAGFLIHIEHQAQWNSTLARRMLEYFLLDWREYKIPVYPIAVLSYKHVKPFTRAPLEISFPNKKVLFFDFDVIDLPRMDAKSYVKLKNPAALALAARMKMNPQDRVSLARDFFLSLALTKIGREEKDLVAGFFSNYRKLSGQESLQLEEELSKVKPRDAREAVMNLTNPFIELGKQRGIVEGRQEGILQGQTELVLKQITRHLGVPSPAHEKAIRKLSAEKIEALGEALLDFAAPADLAHWLRQNK